MTMAFTKLDPGIVDSSLWSYPAEIRVVWITLLAKCDKEGFVRMSRPGLQRAANVPEASVDEALRLFEAADPHSRTTEHEGKRIVTVPGGWHILNYAKYRARVSGETTKEYWARKQKEYRQGQSLTSQPASASASASDSNELRGKKEEEEIDAEFVILWGAYPSKTGSKERARTAWTKWHLKGDTLESAKAGIERYVAYVKARRERGFKDLKYQNGQTFFNGRGWLSEWTVEHEEPEPQDVPWTGA